MAQVYFSNDFGSIGGHCWQEKQDLVQKYFYISCPSFRGCVKTRFQMFIFIALPFMPVIGKLMNSGFSPINLGVGLKPKFQLNLNTGINFSHEPQRIMPAQYKNTTLNLVFTKSLKVRVKAVEKIKLMTDITFYLVIHVSFNIFGWELSHNKFYN